MPAAPRLVSSMAGTEDRCILWGQTNCNLPRCFVNRQCFRGRQQGRRLAVDLSSESHCQKPFLACQALLA